MWRVTFDLMLGFARFAVRTGLTQWATFATRVSETVMPAAKLLTVPEAIGVHQKIQSLVPAQRLELKDASPLVQDLANLEGTIRVSLSEHGCRCRPIIVGVMLSPPPRAAIEFRSKHEPICPWIQEGLIQAHDQAEEENDASLPKPDNQPST